MPFCKFNWSAAAITCACGCACLQEGTLHIVMEYCRYGDLSGLIANRAQAAKPFTEQEIMFW